METDRLALTSPLRLTVKTPGFGPPSAVVGVVASMVTTGPEERVSTPPDPPFPPSAPPEPPFSPFANSRGPPASGPKSRAPAFVPEPGVEEGSDERLARG